MKKILFLSIFMLLSACNNKPDVVYFDFDGTIVDSAKYFQDANNYAVKKMENKESLLKKNSDYNFKYATEYYKTFSEFYNEYIFKQNSKTIDCVDDVLKELKTKGIKTAVTSQKEQQWTIMELKMRNLLQYFNKIYGTEYTNTQIFKPNQYFIEYVEKDMKTIHNCWNIGDTYADVVMGIRFKCKKIFIINTQDKEKIEKEYKEEINKTIFFVAYNDLLKIIYEL